MPQWNFFNMSQSQRLASAVVNVATQGILATLLPIVLAKERQETWQLKAHVILVNALAFGQTVISSMVIFSSSDQGSQGGEGGQGQQQRSGAPPFLPPTFNALLAMSVQAFYIIRCWRIVGRRWVWVSPYLLLWLVASGSSLAIAALNSEAARSSDLSEKQRIALGLWVFDSFALDFLMTSTTGYYLYKSHTGTSQRHSGVFLTAWNVIWAAAIPPMVVMIVIMVDGYMASGSDHSIATLFSDISGKIYALSLMITLTGRGYVRQKLSEVNIGRMSSGGPSQGRSVSHDPAPSRSIIIRYQQERVVSEGVAVQLDDFTSRTKSVPIGDQNDDGETAHSQYSKTDENKYHI